MSAQYFTTIEAINEYLEEHHQTSLLTSSKTMTRIEGDESFKARYDALHIEGIKHSFLVEYNVLQFIEPSNKVLRHKAKKMQNKYLSNTLRALNLI